MKLNIHCTWSVPPLAVKSSLLKQNLPTTKRGMNSPASHEHLYIHAFVLVSPAVDSSHFCW